MGGAYTIAWIQAILGSAGLFAGLRGRRQGSAKRVPRADDQFEQRLHLCGRQGTHRRDRHVVMGLRRLRETALTLSREPQNQAPPITRMRHALDETVLL